MNHLLQTDYITSREFELGPKALKCKEKGMFSAIEVDISYELFGINQISKRSKLPSFVPWVTVISTLILISYIRGNMDRSSESGTTILIILICGFLAWRIALMFKRNEILIPTGKGELIFWEDYPDKEAVKIFIEELNNKVKEFNMKKYGTFDKDLPVEPQLSNFMFLKDREIITEKEFEELKNQALGKTNNSGNPIGFK